MYVNKCSKCGVEFETKNPKRVICPSCLYPDRKPILSSIIQPAEPQSHQRDFDQTGDLNQRESSYANRGDLQQNTRPQQGGFNRPQDDYRRPQGGYNDYNRRPQGGFSRPQGNFNRRPNHNNKKQQGGFNRQGGFKRPQHGFKRPSKTPKKQLLVSREQVAQIEVLYKRLLPLPNPDAHEVIGKEINLEPNKVFFGINLVRQKLKLPKLPYPKRKLAVSPDQLSAIKSLYEPLLPLPPIGCHKIIAAQLKMDEWRVHVGIGIIRKQMNLPRWNPDREDAPPEFKNQNKETE